MIAPGIAVTVWSGSGALAAVRHDAPVLAELAPRIVQLHHSLGDTTVRDAVRELRTTLPGVRLWLAVGGNAFPRREDPAGEAERWGALAAELGAELAVLNCERDDAPPDAQGRKIPRKGYGWGIPEWAGRDMEALARAVTVAVAKHRPVAFTSHDVLGYHPLPWPGFLADDSPVLLHLPQHYPGTAPPDPPASLAVMRGRFGLAASHPAGTAARYRVRGASWAPYLQLRGVACEGLSWAADQADHAALGWTLGRADAQGLAALRCSLLARVRCGEGRGALARTQAALALDADGVAGPRTRAALGVTL